MVTKKRTGTKGTRKTAVKTPSRAGAKSRRTEADAPIEATTAASDIGPSKRAKGKSGRPTASPQHSGRDPRLPQPGTVLRKVDRLGNVRCECTVEADGIRYGGQVYRSLSAAATAAAADLGVKGAQNGYIFWGLSRPARPGEDPLTRLQKSWTRYEADARAVLATAPAEQKPALIAAIERHRNVQIAAA